MELWLNNKVAAGKIEDGDSVADVKTDREDNEENCFCEFFVSFFIQTRI